MSTHSTTRHARRKLVVHMMISIFLILLGVAGVIYMITVEDDPAAVPLLLIALGIGWLVIARIRLRPRSH